MHANTERWQVLDDLDLSPILRQLTGQSPVSNEAATRGSEIRYSFPVDSFEEAKAPLWGHYLPQGLSPERRPHCHDCLYLTFGSAEQPGSRLGCGRRRGGCSSMPRLFAG